MLATGSSEPTELALPEGADGLAVDAAGDVYVLDDNGFGQLVKLAAR